MRGHSCTIPCPPPYTEMFSEVEVRRRTQLLGFPHHPPSVFLGELPHYITHHVF